MPEEARYSDVSPPAFAEYVRDITNQLAKTARDFDMLELERALDRACHAAVSERNRRTDRLS